MAPIHERWELLLFLKSIYSETIMLLVQDFIYARYQTWWICRCIMSQPSSKTSQIPPGTPELWPFNCPKLGFPLSKSKSFHLVFIKLGEYVGGHNILTKFCIQPNPPLPHAFLNYGPWIVKNTELALSALQVEYPAPKNVVITIEFTTNMTGAFCVSLALFLVKCIILCYVNNLFKVQK